MGRVERFHGLIVDRSQGGVVRLIPDGVPLTGQCRVTGELGSISALLAERLECWITVWASNARPSNPFVPTVLCQVERRGRCGEDLRIDSRLRRRQRMLPKDGVKLPAAMVKQLPCCDGGCCLGSGEQRDSATNTRRLKCFIPGFGAPGGSWAYNGEPAGKLCKNLH